MEEHEYHKIYGQWEDLLGLSQTEGPDFVEEICSKLEFVADWGRTLTIYHDGRMPSTQLINLFLAVDNLGQRLAASIADSPWAYFKSGERLLRDRWLEQGMDYQVEIDSLREESELRALPPQSLEHPLN